MPTFLLTWNPTRSKDSREPLFLQRHRAGKKSITTTWSCGRPLQIQKDHRLFMLRQGKNQPGIVAIGHATDDAYRRKRWSSDLKSPTSCHVDWRIDDILDPDSQPILSRQALLQGAFRNARELLDARVSGRKIPATIAAALFRQWSEFRRPLRPFRSPLREADVPKAVVGAGFGDPVTNREVERAAIRFVRRAYESDGWEVDSVEQEKCGFDLRCRRNRRIRHLEVKGIRGDGLSIILTSNELANARSDSRLRICIVNRALGQRAELHQFSGAAFRQSFDVRPYQFFARLRA